MKKANRILAIAFLVILFTTALTACTSSDKVISKWDKEEITLYSDTSCYADLTVEITAQGQTYSSEKTVSLEKETLMRLNINDFPVTQYFGHEAEITNVTVSEPYDTGKDEIAFFICMGLFLILFLVIVIYEVFWA